ncbi:MAG TPA: hypothetical protein VK335_25750 [Bryobacteraceae bacterium]|nr:hypothetical protein [Bryobacteraceae bacterium]
MKRAVVLPVIWILAVAAQGNPQPAAKTSVWTLGIYAGASPLQLRPAPGAANPVLSASDVTDMKVDAVAHPFLVIKDQRYYMFFTAKDLKSDAGGIGLAESSDGVKWKFRRTVIREPFVQSHPFVFEWQNEYYLIPEAHTETAVRLYKATAFPDEWKYEGNLLEGDHFISPTLVRYKGLWWLFTSPSGNDTLRLFYASELRGPWKEHPLSPIVRKDLKTARPAGRPFVINGSLYRLGQDCYPTYGRAVRAFQITEISPTTYAEKMVETPVVEASGKGWNSDGMHHVDAQRTGTGQWIAVVDALGVP